jgi:hypothetical protein
MQTGGPDSTQEIIKAAATHAAAIAETLNPEVRKAAVQQAVDTEVATGPAKIQQAVSTQLAVMKAAPGGFNDIANPQARNAAMTQYEKDSKDYASKVSDAERLKDFVAAAQSGNQNALGLIPMAEVKTLFSRANQQELSAVGSGAGSLYQQLLGKWDKVAAGEPITPHLLKDTGKMADVMKKAARRGYEYNVQINNKTHSGNVQPIDLGDTSRGVASPQSGATPTVSTKGAFDKLKSGDVYIDSQDGKKYRKP